MSVSYRRLLPGVSVAIIFAYTPLAACRAQGDDPATTHHGALVLKPDDNLGPAIPGATARKDALAGAEKLLAILKRDDALTNPIGYSTVVRRVAGVTSGGGDTITKLPLHWGVTGGLNYFAMEDDGHGSQHVGDGGGSFPFQVIVNGIGRIEDVESAPEPLDHGPPVLRDYRVTGQFRGHAVYNGACVFIARRPSVSAFVPMTVERYLNLQILKVRADSTRHASEHRTDTATHYSDALKQWLKEKPQREADMRKTYDAIKQFDAKQADQFVQTWTESEADAEARLRAIPPDADERLALLMQQGTAGEGAYIAQVRTQLESLSPAQRKAQAAVLEEGVAGDKLAALDDEESLPLAQINPAFFDKSLPASTPQLVSVCLPGLQEGIEPKRYEWSERRAHDAALVRDHLDWAAIEALVKGGN